MPVPGDVIGNKYRIEEWLGQGGMGAVFRATQLLSEKPVALKRMLRPPSTQHARVRFLREARAVGRIRHPNVVDIYDVWQEVEFDYMVMELLRGESLRVRLTRGPLSVTEAVDLILPAMSGVAAAHKAGVIHRDLKPDNLFLCEGAGGLAHGAKVLDFGISHIATVDPGDPTLTSDGMVLGTPAYMSPEQLKSARNVDVRTDVYSVGVIFYEALTGRRPFDGDSFSGLVLAIAQTDPLPPRSLVPDLPAAFEQVLLRAIARDREDRYADMESFIAAVEPFATGYVGSPPSVSPEPKLHAAPTPAARVRGGVRIARRLSVAWAALAIVFAVILLMAFWAGPHSGSRPAARSAAESANGPAPPAAPAPPSVAPGDLGKPASTGPDAPVAAPPAAATTTAAQPPSMSVPAARKARRGKDASRARTQPSRTAGVEPAGRSGTISLDDM